MLLLLPALIRVFVTEVEARRRNVAGGGLVAKAKQYGTTRASSSRISEDVIDTIEGMFGSCDVEVMYS
jgi:hypothetical protein